MKVLYSRPDGSNCTSSTHFKSPIKKVVCRGVFANNSCRFWQRCLKMTCLILLMMSSGRLAKSILLSIRETLIWSWWPYPWAHHWAPSPETWLHELWPFHDVIQVSYLSLDWCESAVGAVSKLRLRWAIINNLWVSPVLHFTTSLLKFLKIHQSHCTSQSTLNIIKQNLYICKMLMSGDIDTLNMPDPERV